MEDIRSRVPDTTTCDTIGLLPYYAGLFVFKIDTQTASRLVDSFPREIEYVVFARNEDFAILLKAGHHLEPLVDTLNILFEYWDTRLIEPPPVEIILGAFLSSSSLDQLDDLNKEWSLYVSRSCLTQPDARSSIHIQGIGTWFAADLVSSDKILTEPWRIRLSALRVAARTARTLHRHDAARHRRYDPFLAQLSEISSFYSHMKSLTRESPAEGMPPIDDDVRKLRALLNDIHDHSSTLMTRQLSRILQVIAADNESVTIGQKREILSNWLSSIDNHALELVKSDVYIEWADEYLRQAWLSMIRRGIRPYHEHFLSLEQLRNYSRAAFQSYLTACHHRTGISWRIDAGPIGQSLGTSLTHSFDFVKMREDQTLEGVACNCLETDEWINAPMDSIWLLRSLAAMGYGRHFSILDVLSCQRVCEYSLPTYFIFRLGGAPLLAAAAAHVHLLRTPGVVELTDMILSLCMKLWPEVTTALLRETGLPRSHADYYGSIPQICRDLAATYLAGPAYPLAVARFAFGCLEGIHEWGNSWAIELPDSERHWPIGPRLSLCASLLESLGFDSPFSGSILRVPTYPIPSNLIDQLSSCEILGYTRTEHETAMTEIATTLSKGLRIRSDPILLLNALWGAVVNGLNHVNEVALLLSMIDSLTSESTLSDLQQRYRLAFFSNKQHG